MNVTTGGRIKTTFTYTNRASSMEQCLTKPIEVRHNKTGANPNQASHLTTRISPFAVQPIRSIGQMERPNEVRIYSPVRTNQHYAEVINRQPLTDRIPQVHHPESTAHYDIYKHAYGTTAGHNINRITFKPAYNSPERRYESTALSQIQRPRRNPLEP